MALILALVASLAVLAAPSAAITDVNILNFALNLECLEVIPRCMTAAVMIYVQRQPKHQLCLIL